VVLESADWVNVVAVNPAGKLIMVNQYRSGAFQNNLCHHWFAEGVVPVQPANPEAGEAIRVRRMTLDEIREAVAAGSMRQSLGLSALSRVYSPWDLPYVQSCP
jgi:hypothetical protein